MKYRALGISYVFEISPFVINKQLILECLKLFDPSLKYSDINPSLYRSNRRTRAAPSHCTTRKPPPRANKKVYVKASIKIIVLSTCKETLESTKV